MAVVATPLAEVTGVLRLRLCSAQAKLLADFYEAALGFRRVALEHLSGAAIEALSCAGGRGLRITLALGEQQIELLQFVDHPGRAYPVGSVASDVVFQHFAIVVADMDAAMRMLCAAPAWTAISVGGPQHLPQGSGGVTAFKFRDPEGHPLELLAFPANNTPAYWQRKAGPTPFLGIDHSAISVRDVARSIAFYQSLGLAVTGRSINDDPAQARLDHLDRPVVAVVALGAAKSTPHLELLGYRDGHPRHALDLRTNDVAATCVIFGAHRRAHAGRGDAGGVRMRDPDGHHLSIQCV